MRVPSTFRSGRRRLLCSLYRRAARFGSGWPVVSFAFDDFPRSAYAIGGSILRGFGARGTYYVAMGLMNTANALGEQFRAEDLCSAAADGHELASHTFSHISSREVPLNTFLEDVRKGQRALADKTDQSISGHFAYPFGEVSLAAKRALGKEMLSCRSTYSGVNGPFIDLNLLRANPLYGDVDRMDAVRRLLQKNEQCGGWLIFYTHDVRPDPSAYGCTPKLLESAVRLAIQRSRKVLPVGEVLSGCAAQKQTEGYGRRETVDGRQ